VPVQIATKGGEVLAMRIETGSLLITATMRRRGRAGDLEQLDQAQTATFRARARNEWITSTPLHGVP
jgi:hypothetical protein